jgi:ribose transport system substrate-binding protein
MVAVLVLAAVAIAACGGDSTSESSAAPSTAPSASTDESGGYTGPDSEYLTKLDPPTLQAGFKFKVGYLTPFAGIVTLETIKDACKAETERQGGTFISYDAGLDVQKQVSQMQQLISQKVDLIYAYPVTEASLTKPIQQAADAGIPTVLLNTPPDSSRINEVIGAASINVGLAFDEADYQTIKYIADNYPGAKVGIIGYAPPAESLVWIIERELYWCEQLGLDMVAKVDAVDPTPNAATVATQSILAKAPDVQFILGYNDISTLGAVAAVKAAGKTGVLCATPNGGQDITAMGVKEGTVLCTYNLAWVENGTQAAYAGYDILTKQNQPLPIQIELTGTLATKDNVDQLEFLH